MLAALTAGILNRRPTVGLALGVVRNGRLEYFHGHGIADIASGTPVTWPTPHAYAAVATGTAPTARAAAQTTATVRARRRGRPPRDHADERAKDQP